MPIFSNRKKNQKHLLGVAAEPPNKLGADVVFSFPNEVAVAPKLFCGDDAAPPKIDDGAVLVALPPNI